MRKLVNRFYIKDLREYEREHDVNLISYFEDAFNLLNLIELIRLGNRCNEEKACELLDIYLEQLDTDMLTAYNIIRDELLGKPIVDTDECNLNTVDYEDLTSLLDVLCQQAISFGLSRTEFLDMDTKEMYKIIDGFKHRKTEQLNEEIAKNHYLAGMVGAAVWGKLPKKPNLIEEEKKHYFNGEEITLEQYKTMQALGVLEGLE